MKFEHAPTNRFLRIWQVMQTVGLSRTTIYDLQRKGTFPKSFQLAGRTVAWLEADVHIWMAGRPRTAH
jgi:prophage regulatory protein